METILKYRDVLEELALYLGCDWTLLAGQLMQESSGDPGAIGDNGLAYGLSQIHRATLDNHHPDWPMETMLDPDKHMEVYVAEMRRIHNWLTGLWFGSPAWVLLSCWNWGVGHTRKHIEATNPLVFKKYKSGYINFKKSFNALPNNIRMYIDLCAEKAKLFQENV